MVDSSSPRDVSVDNIELNFWVQFEVTRAYGVRSSFRSHFKLFCNQPKEAVKSTKQQQVSFRLYKGQQHHFCYLNSYKDGVRHTHNHTHIITKHAAFQ